MVRYYAYFQTAVLHKMLNKNRLRITVRFNKERPGKPGNWFELSNLMPLADVQLWIDRALEPAAGTMHVLDL